MNIPVEHALNIIQSEVEEFIYAKMREHSLSAGLMEKILESVLFQIGKLKSKDLEKLILEINKEQGQIASDSSLEATENGSI